MSNIENVSQISRSKESGSLPVRFVECYREVQELSIQFFKDEIFLEADAANWDGTVRLWI